MSFSHIALLVLAIIFGALCMHHCVVALGKLLCSVTKQYNLVPAKSAVTVGLMESNGSLPPGL